MLEADSLCEISNMGRSCHVKNCKNSQRNAYVFSVNQEKANHFTEEFGYEFETRGTRVWICENHFEEDFISRYEYIFKDVNQNNIDKLINSPPPYEKFPSMPEGIFSNGVSQILIFAIKSTLLKYLVFFLFETISVLTLKKVCLMNLFQKTNC